MVEEHYILFLKQELKVKQQLEGLAGVAQTVGDAVGDALLSMATGAETAMEAVEALGREILRLTLRETVSKPISQFISSSLFNAFAPSVASSARVSSGIGAYASGGVVSSPTLGMIGEAGPEAVLPLQQGADGKLGVAGGGNITINVHTPDADSFRRSSKQIASSMRRARINGISWIVDYPCSDSIDGALYDVELI